MSRKILFFGNERLATGVHASMSALQALIANGYEVAAVVAAQNEVGKSRQQRQLEVAAIAKQHDIPLLTPVNLSAARDELAGFDAEAAVLIAYGKIVPTALLDTFPSGIINIHPSLLPLHRGSTPIESVILEGAKQTGVSLMRLSAEMDAGPVYVQAIVPLKGNETKQTLAHQLSTVGVDLLTDNLSKILDGSLRPKPQDDAAATYDSQITKADSQLDWTKPAGRLEAEIRAYAGWPRSRTRLAGKEVIITKAHLRHTQGTRSVPGSLNVLRKDGLIIITCGQDELAIEHLQPAGKPEMTVSAFLSGYKLDPNSIAGQ